MKVLIIEKDVFDVMLFNQIAINDHYHITIIVQNEDNFFELISLETKTAILRSKFSCIKDFKLKYSGKFTRPNVAELKLYLRIPQKTKHIQLIDKYELIGYETVISNPYVKELLFEI